MATDDRLAALEARVAALEAKTQDITRGMSDDGKIPYLQINASVGLFTKFWSEKPLGQGAALSIGTNVHRFGLYSEIDAGPDGNAVCPDHPSTAIYGAVVVPHRPGENQPNIAIEAHAANSPVGNLPFLGEYQFAPSPLVKTEGIRLAETDNSGAIQRQLSVSANGLTLKDGVQAVAGYFIQKIGSSITKNLWP